MDRGFGRGLQPQVERPPPGYWTSADAAGLPIYPGLVRYDEVVGEGTIDHALRFTIAAPNGASSTPPLTRRRRITDPTVRPWGLRFRMKSGYRAPSFSDEVG